MPKPPDSTVPKEPLVERRNQQSLNAMVMAEFRDSAPLPSPGSGPPIKMDLTIPSEHFHARDDCAPHNDVTPSSPSMPTLPEAPSHSGPRSERSGEAQYGVKGTLVPGGNVGFNLLGAPGEAIKTLTEGRASSTAYKIKICGPQ